MSSIISRAIKAISQRRNKMSNNSVPPVTAPTSTSGTYTVNTNSITNAGYYITGTSQNMWSTSASPITNISPSNFTISGNTSITSSNYNSSAISISSAAGKEIVRLNKDGSVTWNDTVDIDEAATAFAKSISIGAEMSAGITYAVKQRMRDAVFDELIEMAKDKGSLTADDLTYLHKAAKIMDKLKGKE